MSIFPLILVGGACVAAFLVLHNIAGSKQEGDRMLSTYRDLLASARKRKSSAVEQRAEPSDAVE